MGNTIAIFATIFLTKPRLAPEIMWRPNISPTVLFIVATFASKYSKIPLLSIITEQESTNQLFHRHR